MRTFLLSWCLFGVCIFCSPSAFSQVDEPPVAINDTIFYTPDITVEVNSKDIDFLKNDSFADKNQLQTRIVSQTDKFGKVYLVEYNTLMVYYPYGDSFGTDTIRYEICSGENLCDQAVVLIHLLDPNQVDLIIPSAFSPNNDGTNDKFIITGIDNYPENEFQVFSRWGTKVYETKNYSNKDAWDGGYKNAGVKLGPGNKLPKGTYFYKLVIKDKEYVRSGYVVINY